MDEYNIENFSKARQTVSATLSTSLWSKAKQHQISWSEALEFGINFKISAIEDIDYPQNPLSEKIKDLTKIIQEQSMEIERLKNGKSNI